MVLSEQPPVVPLRKEILGADPTWLVGKLTGPGLHEEHTSDA